MRCFRCAEVAAAVAAGSFVGLLDAGLLDVGAVVAGAVLVVCSVLAGGCDL